MAVSTKRKNSLKSKSNSKTRKQFKKFRKSRKNVIKMRGGASEAYIIITDINTNTRVVKAATNYQANALEENIINDAVVGPHQYGEVKHSYRNNTIKFSIIKQNTRIIDFDELNFNEQKSLYVFIRNDGTQTYISQNSEALEKIIKNNYA